MSDDLQKLRVEIDGVDKALVEVLAKRFEISRRIGQCKKEQGLPPRDERREREMLQQRKALAKEHGIDPDLVDSIFQAVLNKVVQENEQEQ